MIHIVHAESAEQIDQVRKLFIEYANWLNFSLCFQGFDKELSELPGKYAPPAGCLLIAYSDGAPAGCIALRDIGNQICEMKRLFVRSEFRGMKIGERLTETIIAEAKAKGYRMMRLDTLQRMEAARSLYKKFGFTTIPAYYHNPLEDVMYMELNLQSTTTEQRREDDAHAR